MNDGAKTGHPQPRGRKLLVLGSLFVVIIVLAGIAIPRFVDINTYRATIAAQVSRHLGRPVDLGRMELTILPLPTATIHDVTVAGQGIEGQSALTAPVLRARFRLIPLLFTRQLELTELTIEEPELVLYRGTSGRWNWQDMLEAGGGARSGRAESGAAPRNDERIAIKEGTIRVIDEYAAPGESIRFSLAPLDLDLRRHGAGRPIDLDLDGELIATEGRGSFGFEGRIGPLPVPFDVKELALDGKLSAKEFPLRAVLPYVRADHGIQDLVGAVTTDLELTMKPGSMTEAKGDLKLESVHYELLGPPARAGTLDFASVMDLKLTPGRERIDLRKLELTLPRGQLAISGEIRKEPAGSRLSLVVEGKGLTSAGLEPLAELTGVSLPLAGFGGQPFDVQGKIERQLEPNGGSRLVLRDLRASGIAASLARDDTGSWSLGHTVPSAGSAPPTQLVVEGLHIERSALTIDDTKAGGTSTPLQLTDVRLEVDRFGTETPSRGSLQGNLRGGGRIAVEGTLGPESNGQRSIEAKLQLEAAPVAALAPYIGGRPGSARGTVDLEASIRGPSQRLAAKGTLGLKEVAGLPAGDQEQREHPMPPLTGDIAFDAILADGGRLVTLNTCRVSLPSGTFALVGTLDRRGGGNTVDLAVAPTRLKVEDLQSLASFAGISLPGAMRSPDPIEMTVRAQGDLADKNRLSLSGSLRATHLTWEAPFLRRPLENVATAVQFTGDGFQAKGFTAKLGETTVHGDLALRNFGAPQITFALAADRADAGQLLSDLSGAPEASPRTSAQSGTDPLSRITGRGTLFVQSGSFHTLAFTELNGTVTIDGRTVRLAPLGFGLYGGKYAGESTIDLRGPSPRIQHNCALTAVDANAFLSANTNLKDVLHGTLSGHLAAGGAGKTMDEVLRSLDGTGDFTVINGALTKASMLKGLSDVAGLFGERTLTQISQRMTTDQTPFSILSGSFRIAGGQLTTNDLRLESKDFNLAAKGGLGLDRRLGFDGRIVFSEAISQSLREEGSRATYLGSEAGRVAIPVTVGGMVDRPSFNVDFGSVAAYAVTKTITDRLAEQVRRRKPKPNPPAEDRPDTTRSRPAAQRPDTAVARTKVDATSPPPRALPTPPQEPPKTVLPVPPAKAPAPTPTPTPAPTPAPADLQVRVESHQFRGQPQRPDLSVSGTISGSHLASMLVLVSDHEGRVAHRETRLAPEIASAYGKRPRSERISVPFTIRVSGAQLPSSTKAVNLTLLAVSDSGAKSIPVSIVERSRL